MTLTRFHVDRCENDRVAGWIDQNGPPNPLTIEINGRWVCDLSPTQFRSDLKEAGLGDGCRGFNFPLAGYLNDNVNKLSLKLQGQEFYSKIVAATDVVTRDADAVSLYSNSGTDMLEYSQRRWKSDENDEGLTWGMIMDAKSLWDLYRRAREFLISDRILEIGPGYGRLLLTAIEEKVPFWSYVGLELSESRVQRLRARFNDGRVNFITGDVNNWQSHDTFDVIICSSTFEHLYPDCKKALYNLRKKLASGGWIFVDFIYSLEARSMFEVNTAFVRCYTDGELHTIFRECGFHVLDVVTCVLGTAVTKQPIQRYVVIACGSTGHLLAKETQGENQVSPQ